MQAKQAATSLRARHKHGEELKDEVYRQMFRLEARRTLADRDLALALLRAWMTFDTGSKAVGDKLWLRKVSPICLTMIEAAMACGPAKMVRRTL